jgi:nitrogen regulatory protein P-II 1
MKRIEAIIKPYKLEEVQDALGEAGINGMTVCEVRGLGRQRELTETRGGGSSLVDFLPKLKIDLVVADKNADRAVSAIIKSAKTGRIGDGRIFISTVEQAVRIRTGEKGVIAV